MTYVERFRRPLYGGDPIFRRPDQADEVRRPGVKLHPVALRILQMKVRHVRTEAGVEKYGQPLGSVIVPDKVPEVVPRSRRKPTTALTQASSPRARAQALRARRSPSKPVEQPLSASTARNIALDRAGNVSPTTGHTRAWGPEIEGQHQRVRAANLKTTHEIQYGSKVQLEKSRTIARKKAKVVPQPSKADIADNKRLFQTAVNGDVSDLLRGDKYQRQANAWYIYCEFGGVNAKGVDQGFVCCVGCGVKLTWHSNPKFTHYPKMELDKIITGPDGGQYIPQNLVPMCSACNKQRGAKRFWESAVTKGAKPDWYTNAFVRQVSNIKPAMRGAGEGRMKKPAPPFPMPVPPGQVRVRA